MIQCLASGPGGGNGDAEVILDLVLAYKILQAFRPEIGVQRYIFCLRFSRNNATYSPLLLSWIAAIITHNPSLAVIGPGSIICG
jgi:hypothetical protein